MKSFSAALDKAPDDPVILQNMAILHDQYLRQPAEALKYYRLCLDACKQYGDTARGARIHKRIRQIDREGLERIDDGQGHG